MPPHLQRGKSQDERGTVLWGKGHGIGQRGLGQERGLGRGVDGAEAELLSGAPL